MLRRYAPLLPRLGIGCEGRRLCHRHDLDTIEVVACLGLSLAPSLKRADLVATNEYSFERGASILLQMLRIVKYITPIGNA